MTDHTRGGNGGLRHPRGNGGLLFLNVGRDFLIGADNVIDIRGSDGTAGGDGKRGHQSGNPYYFGSGGGGGGPGGEGGCVYHRVKGDYSGMLLNVLVAGGAAGAQGRGGRVPDHSGSIVGRDGKPGEEGRTGFAIAVRE